MTDKAVLEYRHGKKYGSSITYISKTANDFGTDIFTKITDGGKGKQIYTIVPECLYITRTDLKVDGDLEVPKDKTLFICSKLTVTGTITNNGTIRIMKTPGKTAGKTFPLPELIYSNYNETTDNIKISSECKINDNQVSKPLLPKKKVQPAVEAMPMPMPKLEVVSAKRKIITKSANYLPDIFIESVNVDGTFIYTIKPTVLHIETFNVIVKGDLIVPADCNIIVYRTLTVTGTTTLEGKIRLRFASKNPSIPKFYGGNYDDTNVSADYDVDAAVAAAANASAA